MAQLESKWIDNRSFEQVTVETVPTEKYNHVVDMILRDQRIFSSSQTIYDLEIVYKEHEIPPLLEERKVIQSTIQALKNPPKKEVKKKKRDPGESDEEEEEEARSLSNSVMDRLYALIGEQQEIDKKVENIKKEIELLKAIQAITVKEFISLNRLAKHFKQYQDLDYLRKGVHWVCEYADSMIEREKQYHDSK